MGHGDTEQYIYLFRKEKADSILEHLERSLDRAAFSVNDGEFDRTATILLNGNEYHLPTYAISNSHFSDDFEDGLRPESDIKADLDGNETAPTINSGVWCLPENILDEAERSATKGSEEFLLTHFEIDFELGDGFFRLNLNIWGGQYWGGVEDDPAFVELTGMLKSECDYCIFNHSHGLSAIKPAFDEEAFMNFIVDKDYFEDRSVDEYATALNGFSEEHQ